MGFPPPGGSGPWEAYVLHSIGYEPKPGMEGNLGGLVVGGYRVRDPPAYPNIRDRLLFFDPSPFHLIVDPSALGKRQGVIWARLAQVEVGVCEPKDL